MQTRLESLHESLHNVVIGYAIALVSTMIILPMNGVEDLAMTTNLKIVAWFTLVSVVRSYSIRRYHNWKLIIAGRKDGTYNK